MTTPIKQDTTPIKQGPMGEKLIRAQALRMVRKAVAPLNDLGPTKAETLAYLALPEVIAALTAEELAAAKAQLL